MGSGRFKSALKYTLRGIRRSPGYSAAFVLTLGLGIGANTAIFSLVNGVLLAPLPYPDSDRIMFISQPARLAGVENMNFSFHEVADLREQASSFREIVEFGNWTFSVVGEGDPHRATGGLVTANYFGLLGLRAQLGRTLVESDDGQNAAPVIVLTDEYWKRAFGGDSSVVGRTLKLTNKPVTVVGVLAPGAHYASFTRQDFYANYTTNDHYLGASMQDSRTHRMTDLYGLLEPDATIEGAKAELEAIGSRLAGEYPEAYPTDMGIKIEATPWQEALTRNARPTLLLLLGTVVVVLIIACANVANLTMTRLIRRERELAIRAAMGAGIGQLRRALMAEAVTLSLAGAAFGTGFAVVLMDMLVAYTSRFTFRTGEIGLSGSVLGFTLVVSIAAAFVISLIAGRRITTEGAAASLVSGTRSTGSVARRRAQRVLVVSQVAASFILLVGAGLLVRSLINLSSIDPGFATQEIVAMQAQNYTRVAPDEERQMFREFAERMMSFPGVQSVAFGSWVPLQANNPTAQTIRVEGAEDQSGLATQMGSFASVGPGFFRTLGIPVLRGREFSMHNDHPNSEPAVVVNEAFATAYFRDEDPIGRRISWQNFNGAWDVWHTIVGVTADAHMHGIDQEGVMTIYRSSDQWYQGRTALIRTTGDVGPMVEHAISIFRELDPERPVDQITTLEQLRAENLAPWRLNASLFGAFALLAMAIAAVGIAGVLGFSVSQRTSEFGVRMTFGANRGNILKMVLGEGTTLAGVGVLVGAVAAVPVSRLVSGMLYDVSPADAMTYIGVTFVLVAVAAVACLMPAMRATRVDPLDALRVE